MKIFSKIFKKAKAIPSASMDLDASSPIVIALAKEFITAMQRIEPKWERGYWRFVSDDGHYGSNASYTTSTEVTLIDVLNEQQLFTTMNELGRELWNCEVDSKPKFCVCLLAITSDFDYDIKFERHDENRWRITKLGDNSGLPNGL